MKKIELEIKDSLTVFKDKKTNAHTIALPFRLNGVSCVCMITRLNKDKWEPYKDIKKIEICLK